MRLFLHGKVYLPPYCPEVGIGDQKKVWAVTRNRTGTVNEGARFGFEGLPTRNIPMKYGGEHNYVFTTTFLL